MNELPGRIPAGQSASESDPHQTEESFSMIF